MSGSLAGRGGSFSTRLPTGVIVCLPSAGAIPISLPASSKLRCSLGGSDSIQHAEPRSKNMNYVTGALAVLLLVILVVFSIQNLESVDVSFLMWSMNIPKVALVLGTYLLGMLSGWGVVELLKRAF